VSRAAAYPRRRKSTNCPERRQAELIGEGAGRLQNKSGRRRRRIVWYVVDITGPCCGSGYAAAMYLRYNTTIPIQIQTLSRPSVSMFLLGALLVWAQIRTAASVVHYRIEAEGASR
jgi:hypothetical protein